MISPIERYHTMVSMVTAPFSSKDFDYVLARWIIFKL